jgi:hypothetical protein
MVYTRLPADFALTITTEMNRAGASKLVQTRVGAEFSIERMRYEEDLAVRRVYDAWVTEQWEGYEGPGVYSFGSGEEQMVLGQRRDGRRGKKGLTLGYVTEDACSGKGDDIEHIPCELPYHSVHLWEMADILSATLEESAVSRTYTPRSASKLIVRSDFSQTPLDLSELSGAGEDIDVVVMDFALDDFCEYTLIGQSGLDPRSMLIG